MVDPGDGVLVAVKRRTVTELDLPPVDGTFPTEAGDLLVKRTEDPPQIELKGDLVGGNVIVDIALDRTEPNPYRRCKGRTEIENGFVSVAGRDFIGRLGGGGRLLPAQPPPIRR